MFFNILCTGEVTLFAGQVTGSVNGSPGIPVQGSSDSSSPLTALFHDITSISCLYPGLLLVDAGANPKFRTIEDNGGMCMYKCMYVCMYVCM